jgi:ferredoxin
MPWVDSKICTGCGDCEEECPSGAIVLKNDKAFINMEDYYFGPRQRGDDHRILRGDSNQCQEAFSEGYS